MISNMFVYGFSLFHAMTAFGRICPPLYLKEERSLENCSPEIKRVAEDAILKALTEENSQGMMHCERIQNMLEALPEEKVRNISSLFHFCFKIISEKSQGKLVDSNGLDVDMGKNYRGKFYIAIDPNIKKSDEAPLPWLVSREVSHLLRRQKVVLSTVQTIVSLVASILSTFVFGWSFFVSGGVVIAASGMTYCLLSHFFENRADDFANRHCTSDERQKAIEYLEGYKKRSNRILRCIHFFTCPSEEARIAKITATLKEEGIFNLAHSG